MRSNDSWIRAHGHAIGVFAALTLGPATAIAQPVGPAPAPQTTAPQTAAPTEPPPPTAQPPATSPSPDPAPVDDAAWDALVGRQVEVDTRSGPVQGELLRSQGDTLVLMRSDGEVSTVPKSDAFRVRVVQPGASPSPAPAPATTPTPAPAQPDPAEQMASLDGGASTRPAPAEDSTAQPAENQGQAEDAPEELSPGQQRRKERREKREHALLGAFMMHGATYTHWRGDGVQSGAASYAMDWGLGINLSPSFGMYAMAGGLLGAKIDDGRTKANYGHVAFVFAFARKYFFSTVGLGGAFSRLRYHTTVLERDRGLAIPTRLVGKIPLPKKLYLGIGLTYELGMVRGFSRFINGIGGQIVLGRW